MNRAGIGRCATLIVPQPGLSIRRTGDEIQHRRSFLCCQRPRFHHAPAHRTVVSVGSIPRCAVRPPESLAISTQHVSFYTSEKSTYGTLRSFEQRLSSGTSKFPSIVPMKYRCGNFATVRSPLGQKRTFRDVRRTLKSGHLSSELPATHLVSDLR